MKNLKEGRNYLFSYFSFFLLLYLCLDTFFATFLYNKQIIINSSSAFIISTLMGFWAWMNEGSVKFFFLFCYSSHLFVSWSIFDFILMMIWWIDDGNETQNPLVKKGFNSSIVLWIILVCIKIDLRLIMSHFGIRRNWGQLEMIGNFFECILIRLLWLRWWTIFAATWLWVDVLYTNQLERS